MSYIPEYLKNLNICKVCGEECGCGKDSKVLAMVSAPSNGPPHEITNILQMRNQRRRSAKLINAFVFATRIVQFFYFLNPEFPASSNFLCLVCVGPVRTPHCWFSHDAAIIMIDKCYNESSIEYNIYNATNSAQVHHDVSI